MADTFETPLPPPPPPPPEDRKKTYMIIGIVAGVLVLCCCCILLGIVLWNYGDQFFGLAAVPAALSL